MVDQTKLIQSQKRIEQAVRKIFEQDNDFTGQITLDLHAKDGIIVDIYEIKSRRKV